jgi:hypothetical protein
MGWYFVGAGLIVIGVAGLVFGGRLATGNQKVQGALWGRTFWTSDDVTRYNAGKNKVVGAVALCAGVADLIARAVMH